MDIKKQSSVCTEAKERKVSNIWIVWRRLWFVNYSARYIRFKGDLCTYQQHLNAQKAQLGEEKHNVAWIEKALDLCEAAKQKLDKIRLDEGWKLLHEAQRLEVYSNKNYRLATIKKLREEAVKLNEWRSESVYRIIGHKDDETKAAKVSAEELETALQIRDEFFHTLYYTNRLTRSQFNWLFCILVLLIGLGLLYFCFYSVSKRTTMSEMSVQNMLGIILFGLFGATTSTIFHFRKSQKTSRIPEILSNNSITFSRILLEQDSLSLFLYF